MTNLSDRVLAERRATPGSVTARRGLGLLAPERPALAVDRRRPRPQTAYAFYLGRSAQVWIDALARCHATPAQPMPSAPARRAA